MVEKQITVSADNIRSWIETGLRSFKEIPDDFILREMSFHPEALNNLTVIPIKYKIQKEKGVVISK